MQAEYLWLFNKTNSICLEKH